MLPAQRWAQHYVHDATCDGDADVLPLHPFSPRRNKVDISKLTPQEQQAFRLYGKLPSRSVNKVQVGYTI